jgi:hypothetical protein
MSKKKLKPNEIYNFLAKEFSDKFEPLERVPKEIKHPGDQPRRPIGKVRKTITIEPGDSFEDIASKFVGLTEGKYSRIDGGSFTVKMEQVGTRQEHDRWDDYDYEVPVYGSKPESIVLNVTIDNPNYHTENREYEAATKRWKQLTELRSTRRKEIAIVQGRNREKTDAALTNHRELWISSARHLKGKLSTDFLEKKRASLMAQLAEVDAAFSLVPDEVEEPQHIEG